MKIAIRIISMSELTRHNSLSNVIVFKVLIESLDVQWNPKNHKQNTVDAAY